jgi:hypothetical protein
MEGRQILFRKKLAFHEMGPEGKESFVEGNGDFDTTKK